MQLCWDSAISPFDHCNAAPAAVLKQVALLHCATWFDTGAKLLWLWMVNRRHGPVSLSMSSISLSPSLTWFPCTSAHFSPQEISSGSKGGKRLTHKYKANRLLSSHRQLSEGFDEYKKWYRSWPWFGHLLMTRRWEISTATTWSLAMVLGGWPQSNICVWWPSLRIVPLGRHTTPSHSEWETNLCETEGRGSIQPLFFLFKQDSDPPWAPAPLQLYETGPNTAVQSKHVHSDCVPLVSLCYTLLQAFCCNFILQTSRASRAPLLMLILMAGRAGECYHGALLPSEIRRDAAVKPHPHSLNHRM